jgi:hypothetical protein
MTRDLLFAPVVTLFAVAMFSGCGGSEHHGAPSGSPTPSPTSTLPAAPIPAFCQVPVNGIGSLATEDDYLPHVVQCENGGAGPAALRAQAIAARSYVYYKLETSGSVNDGTGDQVYSCGSVPTQEQIDAVHATAGQILVYHGDVIAAFFVAGAKPSDHASCVATAQDPDATSTEHFVTYNEGNSGTSVVQTTLGFVSPTNYRNRGCLSQWGTRCLEGRGDDAPAMMRFYYGDDIILALAPGPCTDGSAPAAPAFATKTPAPPAQSGTEWTPSMRAGEGRTARTGS